MSFRVREAPDGRLLFKEVKDLPSTIHQTFRDGFFGYMAALKKGASKEILRKPKSGTTYLVRTRGGKRKRHVASAPGETHANLTGRLRRSLSWKVHGWEKAEFGYGVSTNAQNKAPKYGAFLELGTRFMSPRPSLINAVKATNRDVHFDRAVDKMVKGFRRR